MSGKLKAPFPYFGGKSIVAHFVWQRFGDVANYCEPFCGSAAMLLGRPSRPRIETINDKDRFIANFWRAVQFAPDDVARYADWPVTETDLHARHRWLVSEGVARLDALRMEHAYDAYDAQVAGWWVWGLSQWIGSGWCKYDWAQRPDLRGLGQEVNVEVKRPSLIHQRGVTKGIPAQMRHLCGSQGINVAVKRPDLGGHGVAKQLPRLGGAVGTHRKRPALKGTGGVPRHAPTLDNAGGCQERREFLVEWMNALADRLRDVRVVCGDWRRILGPAVTVGNGLTGVFLDPPYSHDLARDTDLYTHDTNLSQAVREWAIANGNYPLLRIALCGYEGEHNMPPDWECVKWKAGGGYGSQRKNGVNANNRKERIWFSPNCLQVDRAKQMEMML